VAGDVDLGLEVLLDQDDVALLVVRRAQADDRSQQHLGAGQRIHHGIEAVADRTCEVLVGLAAQPELVEDLDRASRAAEATGRRVELSGNRAACRRRERREVGYIAGYVIAGGGVWISRPG